VFDAIYISVFYLFQLAVYELRCIVLSTLPTTIKESRSKFFMS